MGLNTICLIKIKHVGFEMINIIKSKQKPFWGENDQFLIGFLNLSTMIL